MRRIVTTLFVALILSEVVASPFFCLKCCPSQEQGADHDACSPWCVACTCCHSTQTVSPEAPQVPVVLETYQVDAHEVSVLLPITPPRDILHVPLG